MLKPSLRCYFTLGVVIHDSFHQNKKCFFAMNLTIFFPSDALVIGAILTYLAAFFLLMSFCAPYWIESYPESFSSFKNMGLWEYCFKDFDYPFYQFPKQFNGCHNIFSFVSILKLIIVLMMAFLMDPICFFLFVCCRSTMWFGNI